MKDILQFSKNWNNKLHNDYFTTLRRSGRHQVGQQKDIYLNEKYMGRGTIVDKKNLKLGQLNEWICRLDTGESVEATKAILRNMYRDDRIDDNSPFYLYLVCRETEEEKKQRLLQQQLTLLE